MKKICFIFLLLAPLAGFSQYFVPFGEDSLWRPNSICAIESMYSDQNDLYIAGISCIYGGAVLLNNVGKWYAENWYDLDNGFGGTANGTYCFMKYNGILYMGGRFQDMQSIPGTAYICRFNGTNWEALPNSYGEFNNRVWDMAWYNNQLIMGGGFNGIGTPFTFNHIAAYDGTDYINIGSLPGDVVALAIFNGELYAGGIWTTLKKYSGNQQWEDVGGHLNYYIMDLEVDTFNNFLYVCGGFNVADDSIVTDNVAVWDGFRWSKIGYGTGQVNQRTSMAFYRGDLYCNTSIDTIGGVFTGPLAKWDGTDWSPGVPGGLQFIPNKLVVHDDLLYIGGGGPGPCPMDTARRSLARWYLPPATNCNYLQPRVQTVADTFYLSPDSVAVQFYNNNAYVDTWSWAFGDSGNDYIQNPIHYYTNTGVYDVQVIVEHASCSKTAHKTITILQGTGENEISTITDEMKIYPNPTDGSFTVELEGLSDMHGTQLKIFNLKGGLKNSYNLSETGNRIEVSTLGWQKGTYLVCLMVGGKMVKSEKIVLQ
ncbi:MAG: T9SS type A sorting domain-containing protein [Bacteroidota bacterium]